MGTPEVGTHVEGERRAYEKGVVVHAADAGVARPEGFTSIEWIGSVEPTNAIDNDTWVDTSA